MLELVESVRSYVVCQLSSVSLLATTVHWSLFFLKFPGKPVVASVELCEGLMRLVEVEFGLLVLSAAVHVCNACLSSLFFSSFRFPHSLFLRVPDSSFFFFFSFLCSLLLYSLFISILPDFPPPAPPPPLPPPLRPIILWQQITIVVVGVSVKKRWEEITSHDYTRTAEMFSSSFTSHSSSSSRSHTVMASPDDLWGSEE